MKGRKSIAALVLLSALAVCVIAAQSAMAEFKESTGITAFTCLSGETKDFSDAHCDNTVTKGTGAFGHKEITPNVKTPIVVTNAKTASSTTASTPAVLESTVGGVKTKLTAATVSGTGFIESKEAAGVMSVNGEVTTEYSGIVVNEPLNCTVKPIKFTSLFNAVNQGEEMGLKFKPKEGETFAEFKYEGASCGLNGVTAKVKGTAIGTGGTGAKAKESGATTVFESANEMESLKIGTVAATFTSKTTTRMAPVEGVEQNPITLTTVP